MSDHASTHSPTANPSIVNPSMVIGIVVGEPSGDLLGAHLIRSLKVIYPKARFIGIGGPLMIAEGFNSWAEMSELSVMGVVDVVKSFPRLYRILREVRKRFLAEKPTVYIGIDSPDFTLRIAKKLHPAGIKTVHYVSPSVWAWRSYRVQKIKETIDLMLVLFPFERDFYLQHQVPTEYIGHPLADQIPLVSHAFDARQLLKVNWHHDSGSGAWIAVLPGSRRGELVWMAPIFIDAMLLCFKQDRNLRFLIPFANQACRSIFEGVLNEKGVSAEFRSALFFSDGHALQILQAADGALVTSGTATLEALLYKKPMVVGYRWGRLSHAIISPMIKIPFIALPNILAKRLVVPEFVQTECTADNLAEALFQVLQPEKASFLKELFFMIHKELAHDAKTKAAQAIVHLIEGKKVWGH